MIMIMGAKFDFKIENQPFSIHAKRTSPFGWELSTTTAKGQLILWAICVQPDCERRKRMEVLEGDPHLAQILNNELNVIKKRPS